MRAPLASGECLAGRYRLRRRLEQSLGIWTYSAHDLVEGDEVVVRLVPASASGAEPPWLRREANALTNMRGDHVLPAREFGSLNGESGDPALHFAVRTHLPGRTLRERLADGALSASETLALARAILAGLREAHAAGILHRDLRPSNIVLSDGGFTGAVLVDFGLSRSLHSPAARSLPVASVRYMSPERAGIIERTIDERSDLYSAGAILYECLTARPLHPGERLGEVLRGLAAPTPVDPRGGGAQDVPRAVSELVARLLAQDPDERYASAAGAWHDAAALAEALAAGASDPDVVVGRADRRSTLTQPALVGRHRELSDLARRVEGTFAGKGGLAIVAAESGAGKSRLLDEVGAAARCRGARVFRGGTDGAAGPFRLLVEISEAVVAACVADEDYRRHLRATLAPRAGALCAPLPELFAALDVRSTGGGPEAFGEQRTLDALVALLGALGTSDRPAVVLLDDVQWADGLTLDLLRRHHGASERSNTMVVAALRSDEVDPASVAGESPVLRLEPLEPASIRALVESMAGPTPAQVVDVVVELSEGSPFVAAAALRGLAETGAIGPGPAGWEFDPGDLATARASSRATTLLLRRLELLPETTRAVLSVAAVLGREFDPGLAASLSSVSDATAMAALVEARRRHILWSRGDRLAFAHDKLREAVLGVLSETERADHHLRAARELEETGAHRVFEIAHHYDAAGQSGLALPFALVAAEQARTQHALDIAQHHYEIAERGASDDASRLRILRGLGEVLTLRGRYEPAGRLLERARSLAADRRTRAQLDARLGDLAFKRRDLPAAAAALEQALGSLGRRVPRRRVAVALAVLLQIVVQTAHTLAPRFFVGRRPRERAGEDFLAVELYSRLAHVYWFTRGSAPTLWAHLREMNIAERYPPGPELAQAYSEHAPALALIPAYRRGARYAERSLQIRTELGDTWGQGRSHHFLGVLAYCASRFDEAVEHCRTAIKLLDRTGDRWEMHTAQQNLALALYRLGRLDEAVAEARRTHASGSEIGDAQARGISLDAWSKASGGRVPEELVRAELDAPTFDVQTNVEVLQAEAVRLLRTEHIVEAVDVLERARRLMREAGIRQEYVAPVWPWLATALRRWAETLPATEPRRGRSLVRRARRVALRARLTALSFRNNRPHALRESGLLAAMAGRRRRALRLLDRSVRVADALHMPHERAQSARARAALAPDRDDWRLDALAEEPLLAEGRVDASPGEVTPSLVDRFDAVLDAGRAIAGSLTRDDVHDAARAAAAALLRTDRIVLIEAGEVDTAGGVDGAACGALVRRAEQVEQPVVLGDLPPEDLSGVAADVRSALCAPVFVRGRPAAYLYAEHRRLPSLFGRTELHLASFVAAVAGAALENAEGFARIQELSRDLERRVLERTSALDESNRRLDHSLTELKQAYGREHEIARRLTRANQLKTEFMAIAAHDLRTPVTVISGFAEMLRDRWDAVDENQRRMMVGRMTANAKRLGEFIENLLQFARIESGELTHDVRPFDLGALVDRTVAEHAVAEPGRFRVAIEAALPLALGDEQRNWQVLANLLSNAVKYSPPDEAIEVSVRRRGDTLEVAVRDHGPGIPRDEQEQIFAKFGRIEDASRQQALGTGLGLYISKSIVQAQGGRIWVESVPGQGSRFAYDIPIARPVARTA